MLTPSEREDNTPFPPLWPEQRMSAVTVNSAPKVAVVATERPCFPVRSAPRLRRVLAFCPELCCDVSLDRCDPDAGGPAWSGRRESAAGRIAGPARLSAADDQGLPFARLRPGNVRRALEDLGRAAAHASRAGHCR